METSILILTFILIITLGVVVYLVWQNRSAPQTTTNQELLDVLQQTVLQQQQQQLQVILQQLGRQQQSQEHLGGQIQHRLSETGRAVTELQVKLAQLEEGNKRILDMSKGITDLQNILQAPKLRGNRGEIWLNELIAQIIPKNRYTMQYRFKSGECCDAVIHLRDELLLPIDSKFSLENFSKMLGSEDENERRQFEKQFSVDVKRRIDEIAKKYILPDEGTLSFAFMYIPAENVYYQGFIEDTNGNQLLRYAFDRHVIPVSPNSLYAYLEVVLFGLRGLEIEEGAKQIQQGLASLGTEIGKFQESYGRIGTNLRLAQQHFEAGDKRLTKLSTKISTLSLQEGEEQSTLLEEVLIIPDENEANEP